MSHLCIRRTPKIGEKLWEKALIACIRHTPKAKIMQSYLTRTPL